MAMNHVLFNTQSSTENLGMDFSGDLDSYAAQHGFPDLTNTNLSMAYDVGGENLGLVEAAFMFTYQESTIQTHDLAANTVNHANMRSDSYALPSTANGYDDIHRSPSNAKTEKSDGRDKPFDILQPLTIESGPIRRARHAAKQQRGKAREPSRRSYRNSSANEADTQATEKKQRLRQNNKVAAAKCRVRQKKQTQTIQAKHGLLSEANAQLKFCVQELRRELNGLRAFALGHADCDCPIARYNQDRAKRVAAEYYSFCSGHGEKAITMSPRGPHS